MRHPLQEILKKALRPEKKKRKGIQSLEQGEIYVDKLRKIVGLYRNRLATT